MSTGNYNTNQTRSFTHLEFKERQLIEKWLSEDVNKTEIGRRLGRDRSTIHREINRGKVEQIKQINGYDKKVTVYYSDSGQSSYEKRRVNSIRKKIVSFSSAFFSALEDAFTKGWFKGKQRLYNIKTFIALY
ncbi:MAG: helix-turn-helix domain-containing protein, partial [Alkalibacterium gilvum]